MLFKRINLLLLLLFLISDFTWSQCSMCRAVLESEEGQQTAKGINNGIVYLMAIPYILVGLVGWRVYKMMQQS